MDLIWVVEAKYISDFRILLTFNDRQTGEVDLQRHLKGKVFEALKNEDIFKRFKLNSWTIEWENGADFAPEFLYNLVKENSVLA